MSEVIVITSGKGGVGKTTSTANIGMGLAQMDKRVVMIDTDIGLRNLDVILGLENRIIYNLVDVIEGTCRLKQALIRDKRYPNLFLLPSAQTRDKSSVSPEQMKKLVEQMKEDFDYIILDCPAGIEQGFQNAPEVAAIRDADRIIGLMESRQIGRMDLIVNRLRFDMIRNGEMMSLEDIRDILSINIIGAVPDDENVVVSTNQGEPLVGRNTMAGQAYGNICMRLMGENIPLMVSRYQTGWFHRLTRFLVRG